MVWRLRSMAGGIWLAAGLCLALALAGTAGKAQGLFSPVLVINDSLVTRYELDQRVGFLTLLGAPGDVRALALNQLTVETLQVAAAAEAGFSATEEGIAAGQSEFAARANLTREQFIAALAQGGVDPATFRDFIAAGVVWRAYVQNRFREEAEAFPDAAFDRAVETASLEAGRRVLLSEIILPAGTPQAERVSRSRAERFTRLTRAEDFATAARQFSIAGTRLRGGEIDWRLVSDLPPEVASAVGRLRPGQSSRPVDLDNSIGVFFIRDVELTPETTPRFASVDYLVLNLPRGAEAEAARIVAGLDRCGDIHRFAGRYPETALRRQTTLLLALPADIAASVANLDTGEAARATSAGGAPRVVMVCQRTFGEGAELDEARLRLGVVNERLAILAAAHLNDLRARAVIYGPEG
ncbi:MAG: peptidylprolyl isomerase [Paracoccaceae bacterium]|nr:peptidylprolyl isomerase [Paracoccaceae bacterium]